jgi:hypothetical protein
MANVDFFVFAGQSNCGRSRTSSLSGGQQAIYAVAFPQAFIFNPDISTTALQVLTPGTNTRLMNELNADEFGLEASLFKNYADQDNENRYILKYGWGSSDLQFDWNSRRNASKFDDLLAQIDLCIPLIQAAGDTPVLRAFIWMQGENDATDLNWAEAYFENLKNFFDDFANEWSTRCATFSIPLSNYNIVIGRINGENDPSMIHRDTVRQAQEDFCALPGYRGLLIDTDAYPFMDVVHYSAAGNITFGDDVFAALQTTTPGPNVIGGKPNVLVAKATATFEEMGIDENNTAIIYLVDNPLKSYLPGRLINGITGIETGKGYYFVALEDIDLNDYFIPPIV